MSSLYKGVEKFREAIKTRSAGPILCDTSDMPVITGVAFGEAARNIRILSYKLDIYVYCEELVKNASCIFLANADAKLQILVEHNPSGFNWTRHPFIEPFVEYMEGQNPRLEIRAVPAETVATYHCNFLMLDDYGYLFQGNRHNTCGIASFDDPKGYNHLGDIFKELWNTSKRYDPFNDPITSGEVERPIGFVSESEPPVPPI